MLRRILTIAVLSLLVFSAGCTPEFLEREYYLEAPHSELSGQYDPSILRADSYDGLKAAILQLVSQGQAHGIVRLYNYPGDVGEDLAAACLVVQKEDPLGAYCVDYMTHDYSRIVSYYETHIYITYRRTFEQISSIVSATGSSAIKSVLQDTLASFSSSAVLRISYFSEEESNILSLVQDAYYASPAYALGMPACTVNIYPDSGEQRIVELLLDYPESQELLLQKQQQVTDATFDLLAALPAHEGSDSAWAVTLCQTLKAHVSYTREEGANTVYDALLTQEADSEGIALAFSLLCENVLLDCTIVRGEKDGAPWYWAIVKTEDGYRHIDVAAFLSGREETPSLRTDLQMEGYTWQGERYPSCVAAS